MEIGEGFLQEVGLVALDEDVKQAFIKFAQEEFEVRVGEGIAEGMSEEKIQEFEEVDSDEEAKAWLEKNRPDYREIVKQTLEEFKEEVRKNRDKIQN